MDDLAAAAAAAAAIAISFSTGDRWIGRVKNPPRGNLEGMEAEVSLLLLS